MQPDGKILIGGGFEPIGYYNAHGITRLNPDGSLDPGFNLPLNSLFEPEVGPVDGMALQADGKILVGGVLRSLGQSGIARLHPDGSFDTDFNVALTFPAFGTLLDIPVVALQSDGKILIGGRFTEVNGEPRNGFARLHPNGALDTEFAPDLSQEHLVRAAALQPDGKILIGGYVDEPLNGRGFVMRLHADGRTDTGFDAGSPPNSWVQAIARQADGKILIGGEFTRVNNVGLANLARLNHPSPILIGEPATTAVATQPYTYTFNASGDLDPMVVVDGLPEWLAFDGVDTISGTPQESHIDQTFGPITITAENAWGETVQTFTIDVLGIPAQFTTEPVTVATRGFPYEYIASAAGVPTPILSADGLPAWLTFDAVTGQLSGTPPTHAAGTSVNVTITASGWGDPALQAFTINIGAPFSGGTGGGGGCALASGSRLSGGAMSAGMLMLLGLLAIAGFVRREKPLQLSKAA